MQTDSDTKKYGCSILEKKRGLSPWTGKDAYVVFCRKKGCQEVFNITYRWKYLQTSKSGGFKSISSLVPDATAVIAPTSTIPMAQIQLGHFAERDGEHYVCVEGDFHSDEQSIEDQLLENRPEEEQEPQKSQKSANSSKTHEYELQNYQCESKVNSEAQIRFVPNSTLIRNNLMRSGNNSQHNVIVSMEILPTELIDMNIKMAVYSSGLSCPNHICRVYNRICSFATASRNCATGFHGHIFQ